MFELPEYVILSRQANQVLPGKTVATGNLGNVPHKFVWYNRTPQEFSILGAGKRLGKATTRGKWLFIPMEPGYVLVLGECGGRLLYLPAGTTPPAKYHLLLTFTDRSTLSMFTHMWGAMELYEAGQEQNRQGIYGMRPAPLEEAFTFDYFNSLVDEQSRDCKRSIKGLLTQESLVPGVGNSTAQDIMWHARLHPRRMLAELDADQRRDLFNAILGTVLLIIEQGGRREELDLFGKPGGYVRLMGSETEGKPCPECGTLIEKIQYLGGACYFCPVCQA